MVIRPDEDLVYLPPEVTLDLGGIAKGWIAEQAANILAGFSSACAVNAGGDMFLVGLPSSTKAWQVALEDPLEPGHALTMLSLPPGAVATSSVAKRTWKQGEHSRHHLLDPRTGEPAVTDWLSVTVVSPHADTCEVFAKALLIAGPQEAEALIHNEEEISYLVVDRDGKIWGTKRSLEYVNGN
jgi:thiamine biosynthesis lipoprotein